MNEKRLPTTEALFDDAACGLLLTDPDGSIRRVNRTFCRWLGIAPDELVGRRRLQDLLTMGSRIFHQTHWAPLLQMQGSIAEVKLDVWHRDGRAIPMLMNAIRREHPEGTFNELSAVVAEDRHKFERELIRARKRAEELLANEQLAQQALAQAQAQLQVALQSAQDRAVFAEQMVGIVSHDLRNPLAVVQMSALLLSRGEATPAQRRIVERIGSASRHAQRLIADLLDFTQARIGQGLSIAPRMIDPHVTVAECISDLAAAFPGRELRHVRAGEGSFDLDPGRLVQLIGNLVGNAIAYGAVDRPIEVCSHVDAETFRLTVHNQGNPVPPALLHTMFEPMTRGADGGAAAQGVGLGLFIVREIARMHRGEVSVVSTPEAGTTFTVTFCVDRR